MNISYTDTQPKKSRDDVFAYGEVSNILRGFFRQPQPTMEIQLKDIREFDRAKKVFPAVAWRLHKNQEIEKVHTEAYPDTLTLRVFK